MYVCGVCVAVTIIIIEKFMFESNEEHMEFWKKNLKN